MGLLRSNKASKPQDNNDCAEKMHNKALHINKNWIIGILAILVIVLSAVIFSSDLFEKDNVAKIISFTATILSIVLSLLAILYSYLGNLESFENLSEIRTAVAEIKATEDAIKHFISSMNLSGANGDKGVSNKIEEEKKNTETLSNNSVTKIKGGNPETTNNVVSPIETKTTESKA